MIFRRAHRRIGGFTAAELLVTLALGAAVIGAAAVGFATLARFTGRTADSVTVTLDSAKLSNYYGRSGATIDTPLAPSAEALLGAEDMREHFLADTQTATGVYCLARADINTYRPSSIPYVPTDDPFPENSEKFRLLLIRKGVVASGVYSTTQRPYNDTVTNMSIFVIGYSDSPFTLKVTAVYDIDIVKTNSPQGFYASVKRFVTTGLDPATLTAFYHVFFPGYNGTGMDGNSANWPTTTDNFAPLWVAFERMGRADASPPEAVSIERFKKAREHPFYLIWWPDPGIKTLGMYGASNTSYPPTDPRRAYNHMGGRTSFMFTVPMFPSI